MSSFKHTVGARLHWEEAKKTTREEQDESVVLSGKAMSEPMTNSKRGHIGDAAANNL